MTDTMAELHAAVKEAEHALVVAKAEPEAELRRRRQALNERDEELRQIALARGWRMVVEGSSILAVRDDPAELSPEDLGLYGEWLLAQRLEFERLFAEDRGRWPR